ncbi:MAG: hypothetical protein V2A54_04660 [Bacteroidota bacterium]
MDTDKITQILETVKDLTNQKKLNWETDNSGITYESFCSVVGKYKILVYTSAMENVFIMYDIENNNNELGRLNESYWNRDVHQIGEFIQKVKRQVHHIEEGLDDLFNQLKKS